MENEKEDRMERKESRVDGDDDWIRAKGLFRDGLFGLASSGAKGRVGRGRAPIITLYDLAKSI